MNEHAQQWEGATQPHDEVPEESALDVVARLNVEAAIDVIATISTNRPDVGYVLKQWYLRGGDDSVLEQSDIVVLTAHELYADGKTEELLFQAMWYGQATNDPKLQMIFK